MTVETYHGERQPPGRLEPWYVIDNVLRLDESILSDRLWDSHPVLTAALVGCAALMIACAVGFVGSALF